jgi:hypothetical protein
MLFGFDIDPDPKLESEWVAKGLENDPEANYLVLKEERKDADGKSYRTIWGRTGREFSWIAKDLLKRNFAPWNDPWKKQKEWAKRFGFTWKESL